LEEPTIIPQEPVLSDEEQQLGSVETNENHESVINPKNEEIVSPEDQLITKQSDISAEENDQTQEQAQSDDPKTHQNNEVERES